MTGTAPYIDWRDRALALLAGLASLGLSMRTLAPGVLMGDSAEFQVLAYQLGMAHTPGYPIYILLAKLLSLLSIDSIAYRVNLFSALMAALCVCFVYVAAKFLTQSRIASLFGAFALTVSFTFWSQAIIAEVYSAGALCAAVVLAGVLGWYRTGSQRWLFVAGLAGGLSLGIHHTLILLAPAILLLLIWQRRRWPGLWRPAIAGALLGLLLFVIAFVAVDMHAAPANMISVAYEPAASAWHMSAEDFQNPLQRMSFMVSSTQWQSAMLSDWDNAPRRVDEFLAGLPREFSWLTLLLIMAGMLLLFWHETALACMVLLALALQLGFVFTYNIGDSYVFYLSSYMLLLLLAAYALSVALGWLLARFPRAKTALAIASLLLLLALGIGPRLLAHWPALRRGSVPFVGLHNYPLDRNTESRYRAIRKTVELLPEHARVFVDWNDLYMYYYAAHVENNRQDLRFFELMPRSDTGGIARSMLDFIHQQSASYPIFFSQDWPELHEAGLHIQSHDIHFVRFYKLQSR